MNQSEAYRRAIIAVITSNSATTDDKVEILEILFSDYRVAKHSEERRQSSND